MVYLEEGVDVLRRGWLFDDIDERHLHERQRIFGRSLFVCLIDGWMDLSVHFSGVPTYSIILALACGFGFGVGAFDAIPIDVFLLNVFVGMDRSMEVFVLQA